jgi:transposase
MESWVRAHKTPQSVVLRARIILLAGDGVANHAIAQRLKTSRSTVLLWRERFAKHGLPGLRKVAPGRGRKPSIPPRRIRQIID